MVQHHCVTESGDGTHSCFEESSAIVVEFLIPGALRWLDHLL
jgi:hypothetical protein